MKVTLIKDYPGIGRKKGDVIGCAVHEYASLIERGFVADPTAEKSTPAAKDDSEGDDGAGG